MKYAVATEPTSYNDAAYVPDLPGCIVIGATLEAVKRYIRDAIEMHLKGMREDNLPIRPPRAETMLVAV